MVGSEWGVGGEVVEGCHHTDGVIHYTQRDRERECGGGPPTWLISRMHTLVWYMEENRQQRGL